jgi:exodeoxyribonuclease VII small subunit
MSFEKKVQRLEEIVRALESRDLSLEKGLKLFEEGITCG